MKVKNNTSDVKQRLLSSAAELFLSNSFDSVSTREIALGANTTNAMINYYFKSKRELFESMLKEQYSDYGKIIDEIVQYQGLLDYREIIKKIFDVYTDNPLLPRFIIKVMMGMPGPGSEYILSTYESENKRLLIWNQKMINAGYLNSQLEPELVQLMCISVTLLPSIIQDVLRKNHDDDDDDSYQLFLQRFAEFSGNAIINAVKNPPLK